ncbi:uncharacterized protein LOC129752471 [Uranotaenia lowii]|uniref:uncharacterized protein LOC129752471 n=1 Tax=Uranotaenia lowii TaxID=190385 RepID=UPI00247B1164|nr:uncharacterized protein LOC129752471 [Uranotaenia lowii]
MVYLTDHNSANRLIQSEIVKTYGYKAYVPKHLLSVTGVISDVPTEINNNDILQDIQSAVPVMDVYRLNRFENNKPTPTNRVKITFRTNRLPETIKLYCCVLKVTPYYRKAILCLNCLRYNHKAEDCRSAKRCSTCGEQHLDGKFDDCQKKPFCLYCKAEHSTTDVKCPEKTRQNTLKAVMAKHGLTFLEAREKFTIPTSNQYNALLEFVDSPTPQESFAKTVTKNVPMRKVENKRHPIAQPAYKVNDELSRKRARSDKEPEITGTCLNNPERVGDKERWVTALTAGKRKENNTTGEQLEIVQKKVRQQSQQSDPQLPKKYHLIDIQEHIMRLYTAIMNDAQAKGKVRENIKEIAKQFLPFDMIHNPEILENSTTQ